MTYSRLPLCLNDITVFPPPCMTSTRAAEIYNPAFTRIVEYVVNSRVPGDVLEFGTYNGYTARTLAELMLAYKHPGTLRLYDSWEGFPPMTGGDANCPEVVTHDTWHQGDCTPMATNADQMIQQILSLVLPNRVQCVKGFYDKTMAPHHFADRDMKASIVHIDCDLYESTKFVLQTLLDHNVLQQGTVIMFDDWNNNFASNKFGERAAARAALSAFREVVLEPWFTYGSSGAAFIVQK